jgi:hypothetical protein
VRFKHGEFTCYYSYNQPIDPPFNGTLLSNNHLIPSDRNIERKMAGVNIGDQIRIKGYLANYKTTDENGRETGWRNTSISREDVRNGACEIIYVNEIEIIKRGNFIYFILKKSIPIFIFLILGFLIVKFLFF